MSLPVFTRRSLRRLSRVARWFVRGETIGVEELLRRLDEQNGCNAPLMVLIDVRAERETAVSLIPCAVTLEEFERHAEEHRDRLVVTYCTVGVRSGWHAHRLRRRGFRAVNFEASILGWTAAGLPVITPAGEPTTRVHTYNEAFAAPEGYVGVVD